MQCFSIIIILSLHRPIGFFLTNYYLSIYSLRIHCSKPMECNIVIAVTNDKHAWPASCLQHTFCMQKWQKLPCICCKRQTRGKTESRLNSKFSFRSVTLAGCVQYNRLHCNNWELALSSPINQPRGASSVGVWEKLFSNSWANPIATLCTPHAAHLYSGL